VIVTSLLFAPLFLGVIGGQIVGVSVLLYAAIVLLDRQQKKDMEISLGVVAGLWMYKPHFALAVVVVLLAQRRWRAIGAWLVTCGALWFLGATVAGMGWLSEWFAFARGFSHMDLGSNAPRMTGVVPFLYLVSGWFDEGWRGRIEVWEALTLMSALVVPSALAFISRRDDTTTGSPGLLAVGPLLVLFAPAVNFYDLALGALPLLLLARPERRGDLAIAGGVIALSQIVILFKDGGVAGGCLVSGVLCAYLLCRAIARERVEGASAQ
jgi:hypothetical protein